jgi:hypothetical protein
MSNQASATKIGRGCYDYRGCRIEQDFDSEFYAGWWAIYDLDCAYQDREYYQTKRAAMAAIDADPPAGY